MNAKQVTGAVLNMIFRLSISCIIIVLVYRLAMYSYHFGYMVFADAAREPAPGRDITISVEMNDDAMDVGKTLEKRGLIDDARIFYVQKLLSEYKGQLNPGIYTLNTSMKASDMLGIMSATEDAAEMDAGTEDAAETDAGTEDAQADTASDSGETMDAQTQETSQTDSEAE